MDDPRLESVRRLMHSALQEAAGFDVREATARQAEWDRQKTLCEAELGLARAAWEKEKAALKTAIQSIEARLRRAQEDGERAQRALLDQSEALAAEKQRLNSEKAALEKETGLRKDQLLHERIALEAERAELPLKLQALRDHHRHAQETLQTEAAALLAQLKQEQERYLRQEAQFQATLTEIQSLRDIHRAWEEERTPFTAQIQALEQSLREARESSRQEISELKAALAAQRSELDSSREAWEARRRELEYQLQADKADQESFHGLQQEWEAEKSLRDIHLTDLEARLEQAREAARKEIKGLQAGLKKEREKFAAAQKVWKRQREDLIRSVEIDLKASWREQRDWERMKAALHARIRVLEEALGQEHPTVRQLQAAPPETDAAPIEALPAAPEPEPVEAAQVAAAEAEPEPEPEAEAIEAPEPEKPLEAPIEEEAAPLAEQAPGREKGLPEDAWPKIIQLLRTPLSNSYTHIRRLASGKMPEGQRAVLKLAAGDLVAAQGHLRVIEQFLEGAALQPAAGKLDPIAAESISAWKKDFRLRGVSILRRFESPVPAVLFHADTLRAVLYQVMRNAYEAAPRKGHLSVRLSHDKPSGRVLLSFSDNGPGFSKAVLAGLFTPFLSTKKGRLGLGLAMARRMMRAWGGDVEASNSSSGGAVVTLLFCVPPK